AGRAVVFTMTPSLARYNAGVLEIRGLVVDSTRQQIAGWSGGRPDGYRGLAVHAAGCRVGGRFRLTRRPRRIEVPVVTAEPAGQGRPAAGWPGRDQSAWPWRTCGRGRRSFQPPEPLRVMARRSPDRCGAHGTTTRCL